jgi:hypothetical protein
MNTTMTKTMSVKDVWERLYDESFTGNINDFTLEDLSLWGKADAAEEGQAIWTVVGECLNTLNIPLSPVPSDIIRAAITGALGQISVSVLDPNDKRIWLRHVDNTNVAVRVAIHEIGHLFDKGMRMENTDDYRLNEVVAETVSLIVLEMFNIDSWKEWKAYMSQMAGGSISTILGDLLNVHKRVEDAVEVILAAGEV